MCGNHVEGRNESLQNNARGWEANSIGISYADHPKDGLNDTTSKVHINVYLGRLRPFKLIREIKEKFRPGEPDAQTRIIKDFLANAYLYRL